jgi:hypothetical protein
LHFPSKPASLRTDNRVATLEAAKAEFKASWLSAASTGEKDPARLGEAALAAPAL